MKNLIAGFILGALATATVWSFFDRTPSKVAIPALIPQIRVISIPQHKATSIGANNEEPVQETEPSIQQTQVNGVPRVAAALEKESIPDNSTFETRMRDLEREIETNLGKLWERPLPRGQVTSRVEKEDQSIVEMEQSTQGDVVSRQFKDGKLLALEWKMLRGQFLIRTYNPDGSEKGISVGSGTNARYTFISDLQGNPTYKEYTNRDGSKYIAKFENGRTIEQWYVTRDGRYIRIN